MSARPGATTLIEVQNSLVRGIVELLMLRLTERERRVLAHNVPASARAYEFYLRANHVQRQRTFENLSMARDLYRECLDEDPDYAPAWARLGRCYRFLEKFGQEGPQSLELAKWAFHRAFALSPDLPIAHNLYTSSRGRFRTRPGGHGAAAGASGETSQRSRIVRRLGSGVPLLRPPGGIDPGAPPRSASRSEDRDQCGSHVFPAGRLPARPGVVPAGRSLLYGSGGVWLQPVGRPKPSSCWVGAVLRADNFRLCSTPCVSSSRATMPGALRLSGRHSRRIRHGIRKSSSTWRGNWPEMERMRTPCRPYTTLWQKGFFARPPCEAIHGCGRFPGCRTFKDVLDVVLRREDGSQSGLRGSRRKSGSLVTVVTRLEPVGAGHARPSALSRLRYPAGPSRSKKAPTNR